jgi:hypothetical protein
VVKLFNTDGVDLARQEPFNLTAGFAPLDGVVMDGIAIALTQLFCDRC